MGRENEWKIRGEGDEVTETEMYKDEEKRGSEWAHG